MRANKNWEGSCFAPFMPRKKKLTLPEGLTVDVQSKQIIVKSPKGELILVKPRGKNPAANVGTENSLIAGAVAGLTVGFSKTLEIVGTGYRAALKGSDQLDLFLGFSHPVSFTAPAGITLSLADNRLITVAGVDKGLVGQTAANIRALRPPDAYKGKGIRYQGEIIKLKPGKAAKAGGEG